ncbi:hypothetical protein BDAG_01228 [Burkholderia dolosa AU0158]|nr:hypothetical protein BDAG_01228 [Burkholderia dolosa AU0158]
MKYAAAALVAIVESHMKQLEEESMKTLRVASLLTALSTGTAALLVSGAAMAGVNVGINVGVPAPVYVAPAPVYAPPPPPVVYQPAPVYAPAPVYGPAPAIVIGWHGDRYWDGHRYWAREEWYRHHGRGWGDRGHWDHGRHNGWR